MEGRRRSGRAEDACAVRTAYSNRGADPGSEGKDIGVVTHGQGPALDPVQRSPARKAKMVRPRMAMRRNAGRGLAQITELVHQIANGQRPQRCGRHRPCQRLSQFPQYHPGQGRSTPSISADPRSIKINGMVERLMAEAPKLCEALASASRPRSSASSTRRNLTRIARQDRPRRRRPVGYSHMDIHLPAGHDACWVNRVAPTAMVMCPCSRWLEPHLGRRHFKGHGPPQAPTF